MMLPPETHLLRRNPRTAWENGAQGRPHEPQPEGRVTCRPNPAVSHGSLPSAASSTDRHHVGHSAKVFVSTGRGNRADGVAGDALRVPAGTVGRPQGAHQAPRAAERAAGRRATPPPSVSSWGCPGLPRTPLVTVTPGGNGHSPHVRIRKSQVPTDTPMDPPPVRQVPGAGRGHRGSRSPGSCPHSGNGTNRDGASGHGEPLWCKLLALFQ